MNVIYRLCLVLTALVLFVSCAFSKKLPDWIETEPYDPAFYSSVVKVSVKQPEYKQVAMDTALKNISMQISVNVDAQLSSLNAELSGVPISEISTSIQTSTRGQLQDVELVGVYEDKKNYWAYFRLNKQKYQFQRQAQKEQALALARQQLEEFDATTDDLSARLPLLIHALEQIIDYLDLNLETDYQGQRINLYNAILVRLKKVPLQVKPILSQETLTVTALRSLNLKLPVSVEYTANGDKYPCKGFPLAVAFASGKGKLDNPGFTDDRGRMDATLNRISSVEPNQMVRIEPDAAYFSRQITHPLVQRIFSVLAFSPALLKLNVLKPRIYVEYSFDGKPGSYRQLVADKLHEFDLEVADDRQAADFILNVAITPREGSYISAFSMYSAFGDGEVTLTQTSSGEVLDSQTVLNVKSTAKTIDQAMQNTEQQTARDICNNLLYQMVSSKIIQ
jgi:hypothetical protein